MLLKSICDNRCIDIYSSAAVEGRDFWGRASTAHLCAWYLDDELMILAEVGESSSSQWMPIAAALISLLLLIILWRRLMNQHIPPWHGRWSSHGIPFGIFSLLRRYNTKYIASFCFLSLLLYLVLIARSIYQNFYFLDLGIYLMVMVCYIYLCVRVARSIQYTTIFMFWI